MKKFGGPVLFLDRSDINTDEIIPAKYLTEIDKQALKPYLLEDLNMEGFDPVGDIAGKSVIVTRSNFGCGSSREHAPWALEVNGIHVVIAESFARIFRQNMYNCGMLAIELDPERIQRLFERFSGRGCCLDVDLDVSKLTFRDDAEHDNVQCDLRISDFDAALIRAGGWVEYADVHY